MPFYKTVWDPCLIITQIITLQCLHYISLWSLYYIADKIISRSLTLNQIFSYSCFSIHDSYGIITLICYLLVALLEYVIFLRCYCLLLCLGDSIYWLSSKGLRSAWTLVLPFSLSTFWQLPHIQAFPSLGLGG